MCPSWTPFLFLSTALPTQKVNILSNLVFTIPMHLFIHFQKSYVCLHVVLNIIKMRSFCMFSSQGLSSQNLLSFSRRRCIMVYFGWGPWETAGSRLVGECWQKRPLQDRERSRLQEKCLSWSLGSSLAGGGLLFQIEARRPDLYSLRCPVNKYGLFLGEGVTLGDATFSSQQLGWALPATTLSAAGTRASVLKGIWAVPPTGYHRF